MQHRAHLPEWSPPPPPHSQPWADYVGHNLHTLHFRVHESQQVIAEIQAELERRAMYVEARERAAVPAWIIEAIKQHLTKILIGLGFVAYTWFTTGHLPAVPEISELLRKGSPGAQAD